jgi:glutamate racemase
VAERLEGWLHRHPDMDRRLSRSASTEFWTTDDAGRFSDLGARLLGRPIDARKVRLSPWTPPS